MREATYNALGMCSPHPGPLSPDSQAEAWLSGSIEIDAYHGRLLACCDSHLDIHSLQSTPVPHCNPLCLFSSAPPRGFWLHYSCLSRLVGWIQLAGFLCTGPIQQVACHRTVWVEHSLSLQESMALVALRCLPLLSLMFYTLMASFSWDPPNS